MRKFAPVLLLITSLEANRGEGLSSDDQQFFERKVRPILEERCLECHSHQSGKMKNGLTLDSKAGWESGGNAGRALVPFKPDESLLIKAVRRTDPDLQMPPKTALPSEEVRVLEEWVKRGAPDPRETKNQAVAQGKGAQEWWSLKPLRRPAVPAGAEHPIDAFINARLASSGISPEPEADRRTLIRRLSVDLHGLLPPVEDVRAFERDDSPVAYDNLVDRLLSSPRYGERWARHWLDTIHFADTHGFEHDLIRTNAWPYRDYVIASFNRDISWPRFIREQLAADVFFPDEPWLIPALGFLGAGPWDLSTASTAPKTFDYQDRDDMLTQTMSTFASSTVHCARCHDHKFDPIPQKDYYALQAVFAGIGKGDLAYDANLPLARERRRWTRLREAAAKQDATVLLSSEVEALVSTWEDHRGPEPAWKTLQPLSFVSTSSAVLERLEDGSITARGARADKDTYTLSAFLPLRQLTAIQLEVLSDRALPKNGPGRQENGNFHLSEFEAQLFKPGASQGEKVLFKRASADFDQDGWPVQLAIDGKADTAWGIYPEVGRSHVAVFELTQPLQLNEGAQLTFQLKQLHGQGHLIGRFRLAVSEDPGERTTVLPFAAIEALRIPRGERSAGQRLSLASAAMALIAESRLSSLPAPLRAFGAGPDFTAVADSNGYKPWKEPKPVNLLYRGDINKPGERAVPGALTAIPALPARFQLSNPGDEGARRAALADWLADAENPLTWRSVVNRVWQEHFGKGFSDTPNDFGRMGSLPSHPELLDWLACEFQERGGSLKALHRLIVTSAAYRRSSKWSAEAAALDPEARLLWRHPRNRLDAESYRDCVLAAAGRLDLSMGGLAIQHFKLGKPVQLTPTVDYAAFDWNNPGASRRSIYRFIYRCIPDPFMDALDFPDAGQLAPNRTFSSSALQALALLNDDFVLHHSRALGERLRSLASDRTEQVRAAFRIVLQREPAESECGEFSAYARSASLEAMCRVLFNSNEFLFVE